MATVNLGNIKLNWKGAYNSSTAYIVDDVVSYNGSSYVCILASTGNLPTVTTYWNQMSAKGTDGTDGTDVGTTITTQGDILYRDGSGLARLAAGTSGQVLQTGGSGANPSWTTMSSDVVLVSETASTSGAVVQFTDVFSSTYKYYHAKIGYYQNSASGFPRMRFLSSGTTQLTATNYSTATQEWGMAHGNASSNYVANRYYHEDYGRLHSDQVGVASNKVSYFDFWFYEPTNSNTAPVLKFTHTGYSDNTWIEPSTGGIIYNNPSSYTGFQMQTSTGVTSYITNFKLYGYK